MDSIVQHQGMAQGKDGAISRTSDVIIKDASIHQ